uniref:NADH dehydrogenase subunit 2 n=1 Tax=Penthetria simplicipes TaxID=3097416 RepID=UPI002E7777AE|nr:NADH dehydrogenase subunit 2 [Penthetria simplicipes]WPM86375.1 NADH dehydrogenase subunit 2 [Penthetria simplicipes]
MFKNLSKLIFMFMLIFSTIITISSNSWLGAWLGLEMNLMSFIPLMINSKSSSSSEASLKYFLIQSMASTMILMLIIMYFMNLNYFMFLNKFIINKETNLIIISLMIKSGAAPLHFWFTSVMEGINWINGLLLMIWQKLAPLMLISYLINNSTKLILLFFIIMSITIGSINGLNQTSLRKLMAFSSINHLGWMFSTMFLNNNLWLMYFTLYSFLSFSIILMFFNFQLFFINQINLLLYKNNIIKFMLMINLLSLGGLPPFLGFIPKWLVIQYMIMNNYYFIIFMMMMTTLITLFFYLRISFSTFMLNQQEKKWNFSMNFKNNKIKLMMFFTFINLTSFFTSISLFFINF